MPRIVVIGATGYTGRLVAHELARGSAPYVLAARSEDRLKRLAVEVAAPDTQVVDVRRPDSLARLLRSGDAVINCAGPFARLGDPVIAACIDARAHYLDTTGEQAWMGSVEMTFDEAARAARVAVVNAMAFEYALGDCAAAAAAASLPSPLRSLDVVYAWGGSASSRGTRRTSIGILGTRALVLERGELKAVPQGSRRREVRMASRRTLRAVTFGVGEVVTVPRWSEVETVRGWLAMSRRSARTAARLAPVLPWIVPLLRPLLERIAAAAGDPSETERNASRFTIRLELGTADGAARIVEVRGRDPYAITAAIAVHGARRMLEPDVPAGVLAPSQLVDAAALLAELRPRGVEWVEAG